MLLTIVLNLILFGPTFETPINTEAALDKGIIFHKEGKILITEKFINVEFLVPFPRYNFTIRQQVETLLSELSKKWITQSEFCNLTHSTTYRNQTASFNVDWLYAKILNETIEAEIEVFKLRNETEKLLTRVEEDSHNRQKRAAPLAIAAAVAGIGLFGPGIAMSSGGCGGITGIFGSCQRTSQNAENIDRLASSFNSLNDYVMEIGAQTDEKFFLVADELAKVYKVQNEMQENQNRNWKLVEEQFAIIDHNLNALATCMEFQLSQQQLNFNFDTAASLLLTLYADIKSYRAALYSFRINVINAIPTLLDKRLPISLVPRKSLIKILDSVHESQKNAPDRLTLEIPMTDILSYYDAKLVQEISTVEDGLLLTLAIPLASSQTVFEVYRAIVIPMPQKDSVDALRYVIEGEYLAISEGQMETTVLTKAQYDNCLGSPRYRICHETRETHLGFSSCLATLKFHHTISALKVCDTEKVVLPNPERAQNLGYGIWLLTSASSDYTLSEIGMDENGRHINVPHKGCNICLITLKCGHTMFSDNIKIRADLQSCQYLPATRINVKLPDPLAHLIDSVPNIHELPKYDSPTEANLDLLKKVKTEFIYSNRKLSTESLDAIAKPITTEMKTFKPALIDKLESYVPIKLSLSLTIIVFIGNLALLILFMFLYHKVAFVRRMVPNFMKLNGTNVPLNPVVSVPKHLKADVVTTLAKQLKQPPTVISPEELGTLKRQRRNSMPTTSTISLNTMDRFNTDDELDHQAKPREESML